MSDGDWCKLLKTIGLTSFAFLILAALYGVGFYSGNVSGYYNGEADRSANQYLNDTKRIVEDCFDLPVRSEASECIGEAYKASHENQRSEYNLNAQQDMAEWAWWVMVIGALQFFATILTLGFVKLTLDATLNAVEETGDATKAMLAANDIAEKLGEAQARCYLYGAEAEIGFTEDCSAVVNCNINNSGLSPARAVHIAAHFTIFNGKDLWEFRERALGETDFLVDIASAEKKECTAFLKADLSEVSTCPSSITHDFLISVVIDVSATDVFEKLVKERFRYVAFVDGGLRDRKWIPLKTASEVK